MLNAVGRVKLGVIRDSLHEKVTFKLRSKRDKKANLSAWERTSQVEDRRHAKSQMVLNCLKKSSRQCVK